MDTVAWRERFPDHRQLAALDLVSFCTRRSDRVEKSGNNKLDDHSHPRIEPAPPASDPDRPASSAEIRSSLTFKRPTIPNWVSSDM